MDEHGKTKKVVLTHLGKFSIDLAKMVFGGGIVMGIFHFEVFTQRELFIAGAVVVALLLLIGLTFIILSERED